MDAQSQFKRFLADIEPSPTTKKEASQAHTKLRGYLTGHETYKEHLLKTLLSGSYIRDTAIRPRLNNGKLERPDIDIIVITNHTLSDTPTDVLSLFYRALKDEYSEIRKQTRSVRVWTSKTVMDVVPLIAPYGLDDILYIPDRDLEEWLTTNPPKHSEWTIETNKNAGGRFKPLVKLLKWWRREKPTISKQPKGFVIECMTAKNMSYDQELYGELFVGTLETIVTTYKSSIDSKSVPWIQDPVVPGNSVMGGVTFAAFEGFYNKAKAQSEIGRQALEEDDPDECTKLWRKVLGDRFPAIERKQTKSLLSPPIAPTKPTFPNKPIQPRKPQGFARCSGSCIT